MNAAGDWVTLWLMTSQVILAVQSFAFSLGCAGTGCLATIWLFRH